MKKILLTILIIIVTGLLKTAYVCAENKDVFVAGELVIGFKENIDGPQALKILNDYEMAAKGIVFARYTCFFKMPKLKTEEYLRFLRNSGLFDIVETRLDESEDNPFCTVFAYAKLKTTQAEIKTLIKTVNNLTIESIDTHAIILSVAVKNGEEQKWIKILQDNQNIKFAELNYMTEVM